MNYYYKQLFSFDFIDKLWKYGAIVDARQGGLLLGQSHADGGIYFLYEFPEGFRLFGEAEGYEYFINRDSAEKHRALIGQINNHDRDFIPDFTQYDFDRKTIKTIDATMTNQEFFKSKFLITDVRGGFAIINKYSTKKFLTSIDILNKT